MNVQHHFGTQEKPIGLLAPELWEQVRPVWTQVHGITIAEVMVPAQVCGQVDGLWTRKLNQPIAVVTADCVPVFLVRRDHQAIAALHAGWRGVEQKIVSHFFETLPRDLADSKDWVALLGPSIRACCYEVSEELIEQFKLRFPDLDQSKISPVFRRLDLIAVLTHELETLGVELKSVSPDCSFCTLSEANSPRYFSYRRGDRKSRQYSMITLQAP